jgi:hypothetical protein
VNTTGYLQQVERTRCECHDCTQARWRMSFQGQTQGLTGLAQCATQAADIQKSAEQKIAAAAAQDPGWRAFGAKPLSNELS